MWNPLLVWLCFAGNIIVGSQGEEPLQEKVVQTNQGPIRGYKSPNYNVFQFLNIPYATAPTGVDKFKAPLEPPTWEETFNATNRGIICPQLNIDASLVVQEDCLVASVYAPGTQTPNARLPVLVLSHGGGYQAGYGDMGSPMALVNSQKIVAVTFNYRLGIHGFLCLGTEVAPGNAGMKDHVALLQWVNRNIAAFGGDPGKVTIAGCSAGGSSVDTLMLSDTTSGLFHQIISESGCSLSPFGVQMDPLKNAVDHAALLNFTYTDDINALGEFYASLSSELLTTSSLLPHTIAGRPGYLVFQPCVERDLGHERFLADAPIDILKNGNYTKVPTLYGYADMEGMGSFTFFYLWQSEMQNSFENFLPVDLKFENETQRNLVASAAKQFYFSGEVTKASLIEFIDYTTDIMFIHPILRVVSLQIAAGNNQVYLYEYGFVHNNSLTLPGETLPRGAAHCDQMLIAFKNFGTNEPSVELLEMADKMEELYLNFILTGNPNLGADSTWPVWKPVNDTDTRVPYYLIRETAKVINTENNHEIVGNITSRVEFWDQTYLENNIRRPIPPREVVNAATTNIISNKTLIFILFHILVSARCRMWNPFLVWLCIAGTIIVGSQGEEPSQEKVVQTSQGPIRGYKSPDYNVFQFWNIPYATAPTGVDKFKAPLEPPTWEETFNATNRGIICPQMNINPSHVVQEDCLVASVYAPDTQTPNASLPVLVVVHGGGYQAGYGDEMTPVALVNSQKIVAVTFNYRLGIHGFLCLGTEVAPGNAGMKDQVALLQWVKRNIAAFGGDPGKVTIAGCSAGGSSVDTLMLSDTTSGLFHQIISESGCSLSPFGVQMDPLKNAIDHAALLNFTYTDDINALGEFYASLSSELLTTSSLLPHTIAGRPGYLVFQPCVERDLGQERFLTDAPIDILKNGNYTKVPTLYGYADMEGMESFTFLHLWQSEMQNSFDNFLPVDLKFENETQRNLVASAVKQFYFSGEVTKTSIIEFIDYTTDIMFIHPILLYLYEYGFVHNNSITLPGETLPRGTSHCDQMLIAFKHFGPNEPSVEFLEMADKMEELYLNFILTGNPNLGADSTWPVWKPVNDTDTRMPYYLIRETAEVINTENNHEIVGNITSRVEFWDQKYLENDIRRPIPPREVVNAATTNIISNKTMWNPFLVWLCIAGTIIVGSQGEEPSQEKVVQTSQGPIRGYKSPDYNVFQFWNIPYATAPTGVDKFKAPLEPPTWEETFNATNRGIICPQMNINPSHVVQEDCLVASVYAPDTQTPNARLPVLVVVHGGGYQAGYGDEMTPVALVNSQKIVAVTFNYRLGIHGFLCLGTEVAPGNAGMKDQVALLQWVKRNIAAFGGDPEKVTIAGCSAGGSSVDTLMLSDTTSGLFHQIISESGCSLAPFGIQMDPLKNAIDHAALLNFTYTDDITALGEFYSSLSIELLTESILPNMMAGNAGYFVFQPCVERDIGQERFLADTPIDILKNGNYTKVPTLYGYADMEGILNIIFFDLWLNDLQNSFENFLPVDLKFENDTQRTSVATAAKQLYFGGEVTNTSLIEFIDYTSDVMFIHPILRAVSLQFAAGNEQVYLYQYGFVHTNSITLPGDDRRGASHCEQMATAFKHVGSDEASEEFLEMADKMEELYLNFILTGNPNLGANSTWPVWKPVNETDRTPYFLIRETAEVITTENNQEIDGNLTSRVEFWDQIYLDNDIRRPIPPPEVVNAATTNIISNKTLFVFTIVVLSFFK
ncbi:hypothetical protein ABMA28_001534 [Loxostege sticticalis]|uniref:Carboxylesterase type B domain-containing protein n=1 Tax=Loxostege sticticalis TaxID=481309 RepID=A0ABD0T4Q5_LOXSC